MHMSRWLAGAAMAIGLAFGAPHDARADWLGLADGSYDVTLTCVISNVPCPSQVEGTVTIDGAGASFMSVTFNGEVFSGDPTDDVFQNSIAHYQTSTLSHSPYSFLSLRFDLTLPNPFIQDDQWWAYCVNQGNPNSCTPATNGTWEATLAAVPEPAALALVAAGLAGIGLRRAVRSTSFIPMQTRRRCRREGTRR